MIFCLDCCASAGHGGSATAKLEAEAGHQPLRVGDLTVHELLQGARNEDHAGRIEPALRQYSAVPLLGAELAIRAARNYRILRGMGSTIRKTADMIIGTFCIENNHLLLHDDRDFVPMKQHLGLLVA